MNQAVTLRPCERHAKRSGSAQRNRRRRGLSRTVAEEASAYGVNLGSISLANTTDAHDAHPIYGAHWRAMSQVNLRIDENTAFVYEGSP